MSESSRTSQQKMGEYTQTLHIDSQSFDVHVELLRDGMQGYVTHYGEFFCVLPWAASRRELLDVAAKRIRDLRS